MDPGGRATDSRGGDKGGGSGDISARRAEGRARSRSPMAIDSRPSAEAMDTEKTLEASDADTGASARPVKNSDSKADSGTSTLSMRRGVQAEAEEDEKEEVEEEEEEAEEEEEEDEDGMRVCEFCGVKGPVASFFASTKRFCSQSCCNRNSRSFQLFPNSPQRHQRSRSPKKSPHARAGDGSRSHSSSSPRVRITPPKSGTSASPRVVITGRGQGRIVFSESPEQVASRDLKGSSEAGYSSSEDAQNGGARTDDDGEGTQAFSAEGAEKSAVSEQEASRRRRSRPRRARDSLESSEGADKEAKVAAMTFTAGGASHDEAHQVFSTEFISAMRIDDAEPLQNYLVIEDTWKQMYNDPIQVPAGSMVHEEKSRILPTTSLYTLAPFSRPREYIRLMSNRDACAYDLDTEDDAWLKLVNEQSLADAPIEMKTMEKAIFVFEKEAFEGISCLAGMETSAATEDAPCDVCQFPDGHEGNEMVFCDGCNVCVHQVCYGILNIPEGSWYCNPCTSNAVSASCCLCTTKGGALKPTDRPGEWAHVSCALWIPEARFKDETLAEPILLKNIPRDRFELTCFLCKKKEGACVQCHVPSCTTALHVACGWNFKLRMDQHLDEKGEMVRHPYCLRHELHGLSDEQIVQRKEEKEKAESEKFQIKLQHSPTERINPQQGEFCDFIDADKVAKELALPEVHTQRLYAYWVLKRRRQRGQPLMRQFMPKQSNGRSATMHSNSKTILKSLRETRLSLDRARFILDLVRTREGMKREVIRLMRSEFLGRVQKLARDQRLDLPEFNSEESLYSATEAAYTDANGRPTWPENPLERVVSSAVSEDGDREGVAHTNGASSLLARDADGEDDIIAVEETRVKNMHRAVEVMQRHPCSGQFLFPVNTDVYTDYAEMIKEPMDLSTLESKVTNGAYASYHDFASDMKKIFSNCIDYNHPQSDIVRDANTLADLFKQWEKKYVDGNASLASPFKVPPPAKVHRSIFDISMELPRQRAASTAAQTKIYMQTSSRPHTNSSSSSSSKK